MEERKLRRGLKDVSPLFDRGENRTADTKPKSSKLQCVSVFSPDFSADSLYLNSTLAFHLSNKERHCAVISLFGHSEIESLSPKKIFRNEFLGPQMKRLCLSWDQFETICHDHTVSATDDEKSKVLFIDFLPSCSIYFNKIVPMLDKWILIIEPTMESMSENYRIIKASAAINPRMDYFMMYHGAPEDTRGEVLFERLSHMASQRLGVQLSWLGNIQIPKEVKPAFSMIGDQLFMRPADSSSDSLEKRALASLAEF